MKWRCRKLVAGAFLLGLSASLLSAPWAAAPADPAAFQRVSDKLICQCGCHYGLTHCPHLDCPSAPAMRAAIRELLAAGQSEPEALKAMVARFGPAALAAPPAEGFNWIAWVMPFLALGLGLLLVQRIARRWRARPAAAAVDPALLEPYRKNAEQELKRLED